MIERYFLNPESRLNSETIAGILSAALRRIGDSDNHPAVDEIHSAVRELMQGGIDLLKFPVPEELRPVIASWSYLSDTARRYNTERIPPGPGAILIINLEDATYLSNHPIDTYHGAILPMKPHSIDVHRTSAVRKILVYFTTTGLFRLTGIPQHQFEEPVIDADYVFGPSFLRLREDLLECKHPAHYEFHLNSFFSGILKKRKEPFSFAAVQHLVDNLQAPLTTTERKTGYSKKHMVALTRAYTGISPKQLQLMHRLRKILLHYNPLKSNIYDLAEEAGFWDDAHFARLFKRKVGLTPGQYRSEGIICPNRILLNRQLG